nr:MAG TPA: hypothetical protein [Caudoviricetes sp.]
MRGGVIAYALFVYPLDCFVQWRINYWVINPNCSMLVS